MNEPFDIVCLCHLAWEPTLFQRPQQLMQQLCASGRRVLYVGCVGVSRNMELKTTSGASGFFQDPTGYFVNSPYSPYSRVMRGVREFAFSQWLQQTTREFFEYTSLNERSRKLVVWLYHPLLRNAASSLRADLTVYDVMDRFDAFEAKNQSLQDAEKDLLGSADVVFSGGQSLHRHAMEGRGTREGHCYPSGIDLPHFFSASLETTHIPDDIQLIPGPRLGYVGAVDERVDFALLTELCEKRPDWQVILIGPMLTPPQATPPNLHLLGPRSYSLLPGYLKSFSVCLLPFRQTELVAHISPTKTPEYLAAGKPVVSTPIPDVELEWGDIVRVARGHDDFIAACDEAISSPPPEAIVSGAAAERARTWPQIAMEMEEIINRSLL